MSGAPSPGSVVSIEPEPATEAAGDPVRERHDEDVAQAASRGLMLVAALFIIVPAAIGLFILRSGATPPPPGAADDPSFVPELGEGDAADGPTSADLLRPGGAATGRMRYQSATAEANLANGGIISLPGGMELAVTVSPFPPTEFTTDVELRLTDAAGSPVTNAVITTEWDMVMVHGPFFTAFEHVGDGLYRAPSFDFFMFGPWQIDAAIVTPQDEVAVSLAIFVWPE